jgi:phosphoribosylanthranilate isomerase
MIRIKVKGISSLTDARYCAGMGVEKLEIVFEANGNSHFRQNELKAIQAWIEGVEWTGEYLGKDQNIFVQLVENTQIKNWTITKEFYQSLSPISENISYFLKTDIPIYGPDIKGFESNTYFHLREGLFWLDDVQNVEELISIHKTNPEIGFVLHSSEEDRPGWMDLSHLQDILEKLEAADN